MSNYGIDPRRCVGVTVFNDKGPDFEVLIYGFPYDDVRLVPGEPIERAAKRMNFDVDACKAQPITLREIKKIRPDARAYYPAPKPEKVEEDRRLYSVSPAFNPYRH